MLGGVVGAGGLRVRAVAGAAALRLGRGAVSAPSCAWRGLVHTSRPSLAAPHRPTPGNNRRPPHRDDEGLPSLASLAWGLTAVVLGSLTLNANATPYPSAKASRATAAAPTSKNHAFVLLPPHASASPFRHLVQRRLGEAGAVVVEHGALTGRDVDERGLIDAHYAGSALPALSEPPTALRVCDAAKLRFRQKFGLSWQEAAATVVFNSTEYGWLLDLPADRLLVQWEEARANDQVVELAPGVSCALLRDGLFAINPYYPAMRRQFTHAKARLWWCVVEFDADTLPWVAFNQVVAGVQREARRLRKPLGIAGAASSNDIHASRSPTEGLKDRVVWLGQRPELDFFGKQVVDHGGSKEVLDAWVRGEQEGVFDGVDGRDLIARLGVHRV